MRILAVTNLYPNSHQPNRAPFNRQQLRALAAEHAVEVIAPIGWTSELSARRNGGRRTALDRLRICDGMRVHHPRYLFTPKMLRGWYGRFFLRSVRPCFAEAVASFRPDVVLACWAYPDGWAAVRLAREAGLPVAIKVHGSDVLGLREQQMKRSHTADALGAADAVIAVSRHLADEAILLGADTRRTHVVYNGIDTNLFRPGCRDEARRRLGIGREERIVLFVGNLVQVKGLDVLIAACRRLTRAGTRFRCYVIGEGPLRSRLESSIARHDLVGCVSLLGARRLEQLPDWYRSADLLVLPSRSEGVPNVLLEANACGTPYIASRVGGIPEISDEAQLFPAGDDAALADQIAASLDAPHPIERRGVQPRSWSDSAGALASVLQRMHEHTTAGVAAAG